MTDAEPAAARQEGPSSAALLEAAERAGSPISDRMLETFRAQNLMPGPSRVGYQGRAPQWRYPPGAEQQLLALLRWRELTKAPDLLQVLLWLDGYAITPSAAREALIGRLTAMSHAIQREITSQARRLGLDPADPTARAQALETLGQAVAAKRGPASIPRRSRVSAGDRAHAVTLMIRVFGLGEDVQGTAAEAAAMERVLGVAPNGRRNTLPDSEGPWLTGPAEELFTAANVTGLPNLLDAVTHASDIDLLAARQTVTALFRHLPLMARMISALTGDDNFTGLANFSQFDKHPEHVAYLVPMIIAMLKAGWHENLEAVTTALSGFPELAAQAGRILDMPAATVEANLAGKPAEVRERTQRIINAAVEGDFDI